MTPVRRTRSVRATTDRVHVDLVAQRPVGHECLAVVVPWSPTLFQYAVEDVARPVAGRLSVDGRTHAASTNALVVASQTVQAFGDWSGWAVDDTGRRVSLDGLVGWAEEARQRW